MREQTKYKWLVHRHCHDQLHAHRYLEVFADLEKSETKMKSLDKYIENLSTI